ncbi:MAG: hypothetical protein KIG93_07745 [Prevotella sp.]|nr:hypothetical protein [Prevotella sp.]
MSKHLVLWVEDTPELLQGFQNDIEEEDEIEFVIKRDASNAVEYLENNIEKLSAAVLDIESFINEDSTEETKSSFCRVRDKILELKHRNPIQYFAFTGKAKYLKDEKGFKEEYKCEIFDKNYQTIEAEKRLREMVSNHVIAKISNKYGKVFQLSSEIQMDLLQILMIVEDRETRNADVYNKIRKVLDWVMGYCYNIGLSQIEFSGSNLADCSRFLGSKEMGKIVPVYIQRSFHSCIEIANDGSHRLTIDKDTKDGAAPYLIQSTVFELLNILNWLKSLPIDEDSIAIREAQTAEIYQSIQTKRNLQSTI